MVGCCECRGLDDLSAEPQRATSIQGSVSSRHDFAREARLASGRGWSRLRAVGVERVGAALVVSLRDYPDVGWCGRSDPGSRLHLSPFEASAPEAIARTAP